MVEQSIEERIARQSDYFILRYSPEKIRDKQLAEKAVRLLDRIKKITGEDYIFLYTYQSSFGGFCAPERPDYNPTNEVNHVIGRYDQQYFLNLAERLRIQDRIQ